MTKFKGTTKEYAEACKGEFIPFIVYIYAQAGLECPKDWNHGTEGPRIVAALRTQGFSAQFPVAKKNGVPR